MSDDTKAILCIVPAMLVSFLADFGLVTGALAGFSLFFAVRGNSK